jgi:7-dehydrocholesterol reductase
MRHGSWAKSHARKKLDEARHGRATAGVALAYRDLLSSLLAHRNPFNTPSAINIRKITEKIHSSHIFRELVEKTAAFISNTMTVVKSPTKSTGDWSGGTGVLPGRDALGPIFLMATTPCFSIIFFHVCAYMHGDFWEFGVMCVSQGFFSTLYSIWPNPWDIQVWKMIGSFMAFELALLRLLPGRRFEATLTPNGNRPVYTANGMAAYLTTLGTMLVLAYLDIFNPAIIYDNFGKILSSMNVFALSFCVMLCIKGYVAPSSTDSGTTGSLIQDFYWGMELYPRIFDIDVKMFTNCRSGMMFWAVAVTAFCYKNMELHDGQLQIGMAVSVCLQLIYISKFFHWEMGYMCSMDIQHDRAGYYICWGCLVWVPAVYTSQAFYLTNSAPDLSLGAAAVIFILGFLCIAINYDSDRQRYLFRQSNGQCTIWGHAPKMIVAKYESNGVTKQSLLLVDGWWQISRHFHYVPEILASFFWSVSAMNSGFIAPYFYVIYLTILLTDRAFRDDDRCQKKYGKYWTEYCEAVPYKIVPGVV